MSDRDSAEYYEDPEHRRLTDTPRKRSGQPSRLTTHVPVRFSATVIERVKELAAEDGKTVSSWIRDVIEREILRRERSTTVGTTTTVRWQGTNPILSSTIASSAETTVEEIRELVG